MGASYKSVYHRPSYFPGSADGYSRPTGFIRYQQDKRSCGKPQTCSWPYPVKSRLATRKKVQKFSESEKLNFAHFGPKGTKDVNRAYKPSKYVVYLLRAQHISVSDLVSGVLLGSWDTLHIYKYFGTSLMSCGVVIHIYRENYKCQ